MALVRQLALDHCYSYVISAFGEAIIVDPTYGLCDFLELYLDELGVKVCHIVDTHTHTDHASGTMAVQERFGGEIAMSRHTSSHRPTRLLCDGETLWLGSEEITILEVPGHTPDSIALCGSMASYPGEGTRQFVLSGDSLLIDGTGRADYPSSDPGKLYDAVIDKLFKLPIDSIVYPGHDYAGRLLTTIGREKANRNNLLDLNRDDFIEAKSTQVFETNEAATARLYAFNMSRRVKPSAQDCDAHSSPTLIRTGDSVTLGIAPTDGTLDHAIELSVQETHRLSTSSVMRLIDLRDAFERFAGVIPEAEHIPVCGLGSQLSSLLEGPPVYLICAHGKRSNKAAKTLRWLGQEAYSIAGGILAWREAGLPLT